jgi:hypothetical protein
MTLSYDEMQDEIQKAYNLIIDLHESHEMRPLFLAAACARYHVMFFLSKEATPERFIESLEQLKKDYIHQYKEFYGDEKES